MRKRKGFALAMVLIVMVFIIGISAVIMDMTTNYVGSSQSTIDHQKLYNAAQSGIEWGKSMLSVNSDDVDLTLKTYISTSADIFAVLSGDSEPLHDKGSKPVFEDIELTVSILDCNYSPPSIFVDGIPPVALPTTLDPGSGGGSAFQVGYSNIMDPNRNITMTATPGSTKYYFLIRSVASMKDKPKSYGIENMVVIWK